MELKDLAGIALAPSAVVLSVLSSAAEEDGPPAGRRMTLILAVLLALPPLNAHAQTPSTPGALRDIALEAYCGWPGPLISIAVPSGGQPGQRFPVVLFIHGGGWYSGEKELMDPM